MPPLEEQVLDRGPVYAMTVLLVDDQPMIGEAVRRLITDQPNIVLHYLSDPDQALKVAGEIRPTVILQDLVLPKTDGISVVRLLRENPGTADIPIIVLSTREDPVTKSQAFAAGANDYLVKLPDRIELVARITHHSKAYLNRVERDEAYRALRESQKQLLARTLELQARTQELEESHVRISELAQTDVLTGLRNRRFFDETFARECARAVRQQTAVSLIVADLDHFKRINDTFGHETGDRVLAASAAVIQQQTRNYDIAARYGGEEFVIVLPGSTLEKALRAAERFRKALEGMQIEGFSERVTASFGVACSGEGKDACALFALADDAMYRAKKNGRNRVEHA